MDDIGDRDEATEVSWLNIEALGWPVKILNQSANPDCCALFLLEAELELLEIELRLRAS